MRRGSMVLIAVVALAVAACGTDGDDGAAEDAGAVAETTAAPAEAAPETPSPETTAPPMETTAPEEEATTTAGGSGLYGGEETASDGEDAAPSSTEAALMVADSSEGEIVVDGEGYALYLFTPDDQGESTCYDDCAAAWPALTGEASTGEGLDESLLGTTERTDGSTQVTYGGWPLYYFADDVSPGDTNGQGLNGVWYLVSPAGEGIGMS